MHDTHDIWQLMTTEDTAVVQSPEWYRQLLAQVNDYIVHDFDKLIQLLYRLDVSEEKIREALTQSAGTDAAVLITQLLLQRQLQKLEQRKQHPAPRPTNADEAW